MPSCRTAQWPQCPAYLEFDGIIREPGRLAKGLHEFLGVVGRPQDAEGLDVVNPSENKGEQMPGRVREHLRQRYAAPNRALAELLGSEFDTWEDL